MARNWRWNCRNSGPRIFPDRRSSFRAMSNKSYALLRCHTLYAISHMLLSVAISSRLTKSVLAWAKGASLGKEAVVAASGRVGEKGAECDPGRLRTGTAHRRAEGDWRSSHRALSEICQNQKYSCGLWCLMAHLDHGRDAATGLEQPRRWLTCGHSLERVRNTACHIGGT